ncbi:MAG: hypothetical protein ACP5O2_11730 [Bacteroidales bacterium]
MRKLLIISILVMFVRIMALAQLPGSLDYTFGYFGKSIFKVPGFTTDMTAIRRGYDGNLYVCGNAYTFETREVFLARYTSDGQPDLSFQGGTSHYIQFKINNQNTYLTDLTIRTDGRILVVGYVLSGNQPQPALARFMPDGTPDVSFGFNGQLVLTQFNATPTAAIMLDNNRFALVGDVNVVSGSDLIVMRFLSDGTLDASFGAAGYTTIDLNNNSQDFGGSISWNYQDGKLLVSGTAEQIGSMTDGVAVVRLNSNGTLDATFGNNGIAVFDGFETNTSILVDRTARHIRHLDGKIWVTAKYIGIDKTLGMIVRFLDNGQIDQSFGDFGMRLYEWGDYSDRLFTDLSPQIDGKVILSGYVSANLAYSTLFGRLLPNGDPDPAVGDGKGYTIHTFSPENPPYDLAFRIIYQTLDKAVMAGNVKNADGFGGILSRYYLGNTVGMPENESMGGFHAWVSAGRILHVCLSKAVKNNSHESLRLFTLSGTHIADFPINSAKEVEGEMIFELSTTLSPGLYLLRWEGSRTEVCKMVVK